jgi:thiosulfate reductase cytochrome b subunit
MDTSRKAPPIPHQQLVIKIFHGLIILSLIAMIGSGMEIYNANPVFGGRDGWELPEFVTLGGGLAEGRDWHFFTMWIYSFNLLVYGIYIFLTRRWRRRFVAASDLQVLQRGQNPKRRAYAWHRLIYTAMIPILLLAIASGLAMYKPVQLAWLANLFVNWQTLRTVHFLTVPVAMVFVVVHSLMGLKVGGLKVWRSMFF